MYFLCVWLSEYTHANLLSWLQLTSQLYYHIVVINVWLTYLCNSIHLSFSMPCGYEFIACACFLWTLCPSLIFFFSFCSFFIITPLFCLPLSTPLRHSLCLSLCWGGCTCCDFDKVVSTRVVVYLCVCGCKGAQERLFASRAFTSFIFSLRLFKCAHWTHAMCICEWARTAPQ